MNDKTFELLEVLAAKLGTTTEYLWGVLIRQASVTATTSIIGVLVCWVLIGVYLKWVFKKVTDEDFDFDYDFGPTMIVITGGILSFVGFCATVFKVIPDIVTAIMNPEYWALQEVLKAI